MVLFTQVTGMLQSFNEYVSLYLQYIHAPSWRSFVLLAMVITPVYDAVYCLYILLLSTERSNFVLQNSCLLLFMTRSAKEL